MHGIPRTKFYARCKWKYDGWKLLRALCGALPPAELPCIVSRSRTARPPHPQSAESRPEVFLPPSLPSLFPLLFICTSYSVQLHPTLAEFTGCFLVLSHYFSRSKVKCLSLSCNVFSGCVRLTHINGLQQTPGKPYSIL